MAQEYKAALRVDKWLWAARFFKTRSQAADAIGKNRIRVGGQKIKPSRALQVGDVVQIERPPYRYEVTVLGLNDQRRPASEAALLYCESDASVADREALALKLRADRLASGGLAAGGRPSRDQRRQIIRFQTVRQEADADGPARPGKPGPTTDDPQQ